MVPDHRTRPAAHLVDQSKSRSHRIQRPHPAKNLCVSTSWSNPCLLVEAKAVEKVVPLHKAQLLSYMKLLNIPLGLLINFHESRVTGGISRLILPGANQ